MAVRRKTMLVGNAEDVSPPILTNLVQYRSEDSDKNIDRSDVGLVCGLNDVFCGRQIITPSGLTELMLNAPQEFCEFEM